ncbi:hypothetical protein MICAK_810010 [Microcystis aeruginosa PCC 9701]|uniref:Uncharacterized protein n=1 Tax=Microcystis aeruginosa PCC 9701 TaxID=721123 RepID=I4IXJ2_MICAE|nr:hypothetical protein MICAI_730010 [Microcystis sp. T1-4]CCI39016.1 hypothetical protein MICAK_810010 [Microcystis aeruginosa PCC 9701]
MVRSTPSLEGMYLRIHFTHQIQESLEVTPLTILLNSVSVPICCP